MATKTSTIETRAAATLVVTWAGLANGDNGAFIELPFACSLELEAVGTFGAGGSMTLQGTNDKAAPSFGNLTAKSGTAVLAITAQGVRAANESPLVVRPAVTAGDGTTSLTAILVAKRLERQA